MFHCQLSKPCRSASGFWMPIWLLSTRRYEYASPVSISGNSLAKSIVYCARYASSASSDRRRSMFWRSARETSSLSVGSPKLSHQRSLFGSVAPTPSVSGTLNLAAVGTCGSW